MRLRVDITTRASSIPWEDVLRPGRGIVYRLLGSAAPAIGSQLHGSDGWGPHRMVPIGHGAPVFPQAHSRPGTYAAGGTGRVEFGSPLPGLVDAWAEALSGQDVLDWGGIALRVHGVTVLAPPVFTSGRVEFRTSTPVVLKRPVPASAEVPRQRRSSDVLPNEEGFTEALEHNLRRKAETLGLEPDITLVRITRVGAKRSFAVRNGLRVGALLGVELRGTPAVLRALWSWGLGQANSAGFGWIAV